MTNHLHLQQTLLEMDDQRHLRIYQKGRHAHLTPPETQQFTDWLCTKPTDQFETAHNTFKRFSHHLSINTFIDIPNIETEKIHEWLHQLNF
jgi:hypothetical protein